MRRFLPVLLFAALPLAAAETQRYIVTMRPVANRPAVRVLGDNDDVRSHAARELGIIDGFAADLTNEEVVALKRTPGVRSIDPIVERHLLDTTPLFAPRAEGSAFAASQTVPYGIDLVHARDVWTVSRGANVNVAIFDTGIIPTHPDLAANFAGGYNAQTQDGNFLDDHGHGTHVAGTIAALDNGVGVVGVAPQARIWSVKVLNAQGSGTNEDVIVAADWLLKKKQEVGGNWVVSMSFGSGEGSAPEEQAFHRLNDAGVLCVAAAGNNGVQVLDFPAAYPSVLSVGAVDATKTVTWFSSGGGTLGVVAPGLDVLSTVLVGSVPGSGADRGGIHIDGRPFKYSGRGKITGEVVLCGFGAPGACGNAQGKIALISRGNGFYFGEKVLNAIADGAIAAVIYNNEDAAPGNWSLIRPICEVPSVCVDNPDDLAYRWPVTMYASKADGMKLMERNGPITIEVWDDDYAMKSGTSMATPHVSGVAALLWSLAPKAQALDVRRAIELTANDLGPKGFDGVYGNGLVDALAAAKAIAPAAFGLPASPLPPPSRRRSAGH